MSLKCVRVTTPPAPWLNDAAEDMQVCMHYVNDSKFFLYYIDFIY